MYNEEGLIKLKKGQTWLINTYCWSVMVDHGNKRLTPLRRFVVGNIQSWLTMMNDVRQKWSVVHNQCSLIMLIPLSHLRTTSMASESSLSSHWSSFPCTSSHIPPNVSKRLQTFWAFWFWCGWTPLTATHNWDQRVKSHNQSGRINHPPCRRPLHRSSTIPCRWGLL